MNLPAMMNLMLEQMGQHAQTAVMLRGVARDGHEPSEVCIAQLLAVRDQSAAHQGLLALEVGAVGERLVFVEKNT